MILSGRVTGDSPFLMAQPWGKNLFLTINALSPSYLTSVPQCFTGPGILAPPCKPHHLYLFSATSINQCAPFTAVLLLLLGFSFILLDLCLPLIWALNLHNCPTWQTQAHWIVYWYWAKMFSLHQKGYRRGLSLIISHSPHFSDCAEEFMA